MIIAVFIAALPLSYQQNLKIMITLKNVLKVNGISSGATGIALVVFSGFFASLFEVTQRIPFVSVGLFLLVFAGFVIIAAFQKNIPPQWVKAIIALDALWVLGSFVAAVWLNATISMIGVILILLVAVWVGAMAILQYKGATTGRKWNNAL